MTVRNIIHTATGGAAILRQSSTAELSPGVWNRMLRSWGLFQTVQIMSRSFEWMMASTVLLLAV